MGNFSKSKKNTKDNVNVREVDLTPEQVEDEEARAFIKHGLRFVITHIAICAIVMLICKTVIMISIIPSGSMESTIMTGDVVISTRYDVGEEDLERYDILIFIPPDNPDEIYIKRLIGLPGETIVVSEGEVYADGVKLDDSFTNGPQNMKGDGTFVVPEGCYFFLGDNRNNSKDSRYWNNPYVPQENILAKAKFILLPFSSMRTLDY